MTAVSVRRGLPLDPLLLGAAVLLAALGTVMVASASISLADRNAGEPLFYLLRHLAALGLGGVAFAFALGVPSETWHRLHWALLLLTIVLLAVVLVPSIGQQVNGARRWLDLGPITVQASEPARLCLLIYLASYAARRESELATSFKGFAKPLAVVALAAALLLAEPDFGAAVVLAATSLGVLFVAGARLRDFAAAVLVGGAALAALALTSPYRVARLMAFLDPWEDPFASGFQLTQSLIAIGRGGWFGVGLGESVQKLFYLPEAHTDFVFAVLSEELGFVGSTLVVVLFGIVVFRAIALGRQALRRGLKFQGLLCVGIGVMLGLEAFINMGVNAGLLPTKGLTLPLLSYGRSSTVVTMAALGLLVRIYYEVNRPARRAMAGARVAPRAAVGIAAGKPLPQGKAA
ncbi:MAG TPA: putative lipid II flippase FtsW [Gammaproteobacteria bacterium]